MKAPQADDPSGSALLVGTAPRLALAISRSLAAHGITVYAVPSTDDEGPIATRTIARYFALPDARKEPQGFDEGLERVVKSTGARVLIPCSDTALAAIARNDAGLRALATPACPSPRIVGNVLDKSVTIGFAQTLAIDVPETYEVGVTSTAREAAALMAYPVIAKPRNHAAHGGIRIRHFTEADELEAAFAEDPAFESRYLVQQFVPGTGIGVAALMRAGEPIATFVHRRIKELPASGGVSVVSESVPRERSLVEKAIGLLRAIEWEGVALVEFRRTADGTDWLMEVNGRYWGSLSTAIAAGVDFPFYQWEIMHGRTPAVPADYLVGRRVRWTRGALLRLRERLFERPAFGTRPLTKAQELRSFFTEDLARDVRSAMWDWREPLPAIIDALPGVSRLLTTATSAAFKPLVPRRFLRARRRFGTGGALRYSTFALARAIGLRSERLPKPFAPRSALFVCSGNIMRSVLAQAVFQEALARRGLEVAVDSAGLRARPGLPAHEATLSAANAAGLDVRAHRSKRIDAVDVESFDAVFVMDRLQAFEIARRFPRAAGKTYLLGACLPGFARVEIEDPSLTVDEDERRRIFDLVRDRTAALAELVANAAATPVSRAQGAPASAKEPENAVRTKADARPRVVEVKPFDLASWTALDRVAAPTFQARPAWALALADSNPSLSPSPLACRLDDGSTCIVPLVRLRSRVGWRVYSGTPLGGYTVVLNEDGSVADAAHAKAAYAAVLASGVHAIAITPWPLAQADLDGLPGKIVRRETSVIDLSIGAQAALANMDGNSRRMAGQAVRRGVRCERARGESAIDRYYAMLEESAIRWGRERPTFPKRLLEALVARGGDDVEIWFATFEGEAIAGGVMLYGSDEANFWSAAMRSDFGTLRPSNALNVALITAAAERGVRWYNLGESEGLPGVARFKQGLGAGTVPYSTWRLERPPYALFSSLRAWLTRKPKRAAAAQLER